MRKRRTAPAIRSSEFAAEQLAPLSASTAADCIAVSGAPISRTALNQAAQLMLARYAARIYFGL